MSLTVSIGRNVGSVPLSDSLWNVFKDDAERILRSTVGNPDAEFTGHGSWGSVPEDSELFLTYEPNLSEVDALKDSLSALAFEFSQDAIAVTVGNVDFVLPHPSAIPALAS